MFGKQTCLPHLTGNLRVRIPLYVLLYLAGNLFCGQMSCPAVKAKNFSVALSAISNFRKAAGGKQTGGKAAEKFFTTVVIIAGMYNACRGNKA